jgi:hypothetical protein
MWSTAAPAFFTDTHAAGQLCPVRKGRFASNQCNIMESTCMESTCRWVRDMKVAF